MLNEIKQWNTLFLKFTTETILESQRKPVVCFFTVQATGNVISFSFWLLVTPYSCNHRYLIYLTYCSYMHL